MAPYVNQLKVREANRNLQFSDKNNGLTILRQTFLIAQRTKTTPSRYESCTFIREALQMLYLLACPTWTVGNSRIKFRTQGCWVRRKNTFLCAVPLIQFVPKWRNGKSGWSLPLKQNRKFTQKVEKFGKLQLLLSFFSQNLILKSGRFLSDQLINGWRDCLSFRAKEELWEWVREKKWGGFKVWMGVRRRVRVSERVRKSERERKRVSWTVYERRESEIVSWNDLVSECVRVKERERTWMSV